MRFAEPVDAKAISDLYVRTYTPREGGAAHDHYPFPQIMEEDAIIDLIASGKVLWVVAEAPDGHIIGSAAAVRNIGGPQDQIAEVFGVVVDQSCQRQGVGSCLLQRLRNELAAIAQFILCEARTAEAGGWKAARNAGFRPIGFEPYAHAMPVGFESMVLTASWSQGWTAETRYLPPAENTNASVKLADVVCSPPLANPYSVMDSDCLLPIPVGSKVSEICASSVKVCRDDPTGERWFTNSQLPSRTQSSVAELWPFHGVERRFRRFVHAYYVASLGGSDIAAARVFYDRIDARARVLGLRTTIAGVEPHILAGIVDNIDELTGGGPVVVIVCVSSGSCTLQQSLEALGFRPTAFLPGMISNANGRTGVIQYTKLVRKSWPQSVRAVTAVEWPEARSIIDQVVEGGV